MCLLVVKLYSLVWNRREVRKKGGKVSLKSREWVMAKKERRRRQGKGYDVFIRAQNKLVGHLLITIY